MSGDDLGAIRAERVTAERAGPEKWSRKMVLVLGCRLER